MNMKSLITLTALTAAGAASAAVTSGNTLCRIEVNSGTKSTIVAVPLVKIGDTPTPANIPVTELVLTDNLEEDDTILHWNGTSWDAWEIAVEEGAGAKSWKPTTISEGSNNSQSAPAADTALARGDAIWVNRADTEKPFYVYGQVTTAAATSTAVKGSQEKPVYTMMGNASLAPVALNKEGLWPTTGDNVVAAGDTIAVAAANNFGRKEYTYVAGKGWCTLQRVEGVKKWVATTDTIDAGCGFWYISRGGNPTVNW